MAATQQTFEITISLQHEGRTGGLIVSIPVQASSRGRAEAQAKRQALKLHPAYTRAYAFLK